MPKIKYKNVALLLFSLFFYSWGEPIWVILLIISASVDFINGQIIDRYRDKWQSKCALISSLIINIGLLVSFKYIDLFISSINYFGANLPLANIALPIGISFYTFQTLSYSIDVYRKKAKVNRNFFSFLLYVSLFPQLIAGPILRYTDLQDQLDKRNINLENIAYGIMRFVFGLGKKVLIANYAGATATKILSSEISSLSVTQSWLGILMFGFQIYFDFSGYSDMAIGLGRIFGFKYPENFDYPYKSKSITEFWRRWHISLGSFFRDYVYIPLGGNRKFQLRNIIIVWFLTGLWHGASWNFVIWGLYFGLILIVEKYLLKNIISKIPNFIAWFYSFIIVTIGWVWFYFTDLSQCIDLLKSMFGLNSNELMNINTQILLINNAPLFIISFLISIGVLKRLISFLLDDMSDYKHINKTNIVKIAICIMLILGIMTLSTISLVGSSYNPFLYFRF